MRTRLLSLVLVAAALVAGPARARSVTDMLGRKVDVPDHIGKVVALSPPSAYLLYAIDASLLAGLTFPLREEEKEYTSEAYRSLPVIGGRVGEGRQVNVELLARLAPDVALVWARSGEPDAIDCEYERMLASIRIPAVYLRFDTLAEYPAAIRFLGDLLDRRERARTLAAYTEDVLAKVGRAMASLPETQRVKVYYAEGRDGFSTDGNGMHTELIPMAGGINVHQRPSRTALGMEPISPEQVLLYDPDVILVKERGALAVVLGDSRWRDLRAVREHHVRLIPHMPYNWFDRPPSFMRFLGVQWLANLLHPERFALDLPAETKRFYELFLGMHLTDAQVADVLAR